jgi:hypothetical protein
MDEREKRLLHNKGLRPEDYYLDAQGLLIFTAVYLLKRGYCCRTGCRHCPVRLQSRERKGRQGKAQPTTRLPAFRPAKHSLIRQYFPIKPPFGLHDLGKTRIFATCF